MPRGRGLSDKDREAIYTQYTLGESTEDIAQSRQLNPQTVRRVVREQRKRHEKEREEMARSGKIVKKDGSGGKLMALSGDGFEFTHVTRDGKSHRKRVTGHLSKVAEQQYDKWCEELDSELEFMSRVERNHVEMDLSDEPTFEDEAVDVTPAPVPDIRVRPWREVAEERERELESLREELAEAKRAVEYLTGRIDEYESSDWVSREAAEAMAGTEHVIADTEGAEPKLGHWFNSNGSFAVVWRDKPVYLLWAKGEQPRCYGVYQHSEGVLKDADRLNEMASFLGHDGAFEIEEVAWR